MCQCFTPEKERKRRGEKKRRPKVRNHFLREPELTQISPDPVQTHFSSFSSCLTLPWRSCFFHAPSLIHPLPPPPPPHPPVSLTPSVPRGLRQLLYSRRAPYMAASCLSWLASSIHTHTPPPPPPPPHTITPLRALESQMRRRSTTWKCYISNK